MDKLLKVLIDTGSPTRLTQEDIQKSNFTGMKAVANANQEKQKDLMYIKFVLCHEKNNLNSYWFFKNELENSYDSAIFKNYNWEHGEPILGVITDSVLVKPPIGSSDPRWRVECGAVIWKWVFPEYAQKVAEKAMIGELRNSMECYFEDYVYVLGDEEKIYSRSEKPELEYYIGKIYKGYKVYKGFINMFFGGVGIVANPADPDAVFQAVASRDMNINSDNLVEFVTNDVEKEVLGMENLHEEVDEVVEKMEVEQIDESTTIDHVESAESVEQAELEELKDDTEDKATSEELDVGEGGKEGKDDLEVQIETVMEINADDANDETKEDVANEEVKSEEVDTEETETTEEKDTDTQDADVGEEKTEDKKEYARKEDSVYEQAENSVKEYLERLNLYSTFENLFDALRWSLDDIVWMDLEDKPNLIIDEVMVFLSEILSCVQAIDSGYVVNSQNESTESTDQVDANTLVDELKQVIESIQKENSELKDALDKVKQEYQTFKDEVEAEKAAKAKEKLADVRLSELASLGCNIEGEKESRIREKVKNYTEEQYNDFKSLFLDVVQPILSKSEANIKKNKSLDLAALNFESSKKPTLEEDFKKLAEAIFNSN